VWLLEHVLTATDASITCIDFFTEAYELRFDHNIRVSGAESKVTKLKGLSHDVLLDLAGSRFEIVYVDGSHEASAVYLDAVLCWPMLVRGGVLIFDDYLWHPGAPPSQRPQLAIDLFLEQWAGEIEVLHKQWQVAVKKR
jgi:predicted O-methyltransferase YrrM